MNDRPDLFMVVEAFLFGLIVPAGSLYAITTEPLSGILAPLGDATLLIWSAAIILGTVLLTEWRVLSTGALLGGELLGVISGFLAFAAFVGWSVVMFAIAAIGILAIVIGAWAAYERDRHYGRTREFPFGTWRYVFGILVLLPAVFLLLLMLF